MFLLNMDFIWSSEVEKIYFMCEIKAKFNKNHLKLHFIIYNHFSKEIHFTFFKLSLFSGFVP